MKDNQHMHIEENREFQVDEGARVHPLAIVGSATAVWDGAEIREEAVIGAESVIGRGVYIDVGVRVGNRCKIQNEALLYSPALIEDGVFIGPGAILTNDKFPRAVNPDGTLKRSTDWTRLGVTVREGASIGAGAVILPEVEVGRWSVVAAGAVVTSDVPDHGLVAGVPACQTGWVGRRGVPLSWEGDELVDPESGERFILTDNGLVTRP